MSITEWASNNPYKVGGAVFAVGAIALLMFAGGKKESAGMSGTALYLGPTAAEIESGTALAVNQAQVSLAASIADRQAEVETLRINTDKEVQLSGLALLMSKITGEKDTVDKAIQNDFILTENSDNRAYLARLNGQSLDYSLRVNEQNIGAGKASQDFYQIAGALGAGYSVTRGANGELVFMR